MTQTSPATALDGLDQFEPAVSGRARRTLLKRLIDVVAMPSSNLPPQDRSMGSDILLELLFGATQDEIRLCARRLSDKSEAPRRLLRFLAAAPIDSARYILEDNLGIEEADLAHVATVATHEHRKLIAQRKNVGPMLAEVLIDFSEPDVVQALLRNREARISDLGLDGILKLSREHDSLCGMLLSRPELTPAHAMAMFWWSDEETRLAILNRHAAERLDLIEACGDIFPMLAEEGWQDAVTRKALSLIERRQRNRAAIAKSEFVNLEHAVEVAAKDGMSSTFAQEIGYLAGVKPITIAKLLSDVGGEGLAVLCKATGMKVAYLKLLWKALRRRETDEAGDLTPDFKRVLYCYQVLTVARAQTVLRYWNWSLSSAYSPGQGEINENEDPEQAILSAARRTARLVFGS
ncbi:MAG: DUF2336 domain-containing protein [Pseudomonadota bacterium]